MTRTLPLPFPVSTTPEILQRLELPTNVPEPSSSYGYNHLSTATDPTATFHRERQYGNHSRPQDDGLTVLRPTIANGHVMPQDHTVSQRLAQLYAASPGPLVPSKAPTDYSLAQWQVAATIGSRQLGEGSGLLDWQSISVPLSLPRSGQNANENMAGAQAQRGSKLLFVANDTERTGAPDSGFGNASAFSSAQVLPVDVGLREEHIQNVASHSRRSSPTVPDVLSGALEDEQPVHPAYWQESTFFPSPDALCPHPHSRYQGSWWTKRPHSVLETCASARGANQATAELPPVAARSDIPCGSPQPYEISPREGIFVGPSKGIATCEPHLLTGLWAQELGARVPDGQNAGNTEPPPSAHYELRPDTNGPPFQPRCDQDMADGDVKQITEFRQLRNVRTRNHISRTSDLCQTAHSHVMTSIDEDCPLADLEVQALMVNRGDRAQWARHLQAREHR
ncbi:hypothetical protein FRB90_002570 [Tulasnella sp. 427]|nr:hypothetical protein FRB90_002570 [Tulasnella sp. 427]